MTDGIHQTPEPLNGHAMTDIIASIEELEALYGAYSPMPSATFDDANDDAALADRQAATLY